MITIKCEYCGEEKIIRSPAGSYVYKLRLSKTNHICYFCSFSCMQKEQKENSAKYRQTRSKIL